MLYSLKIDAAVVQDLQSIGATSSQARSRIAVLLQELKGSQDYLDRLSQDGFGPDRSTDVFNVREWVAQRSNNLWRLKDWSLERAGLQYRIVYVFLPKSRVYVILGITHRSWDYSDACQFGQRVVERAVELLSSDR